jgi:DNA polymerase III epsilon subunit-like protein
MKICIVDFEATGSDPKNDRPTQVAALMLDTVTGKRRTYSAYISGDGYPSITEEITRITGITEELLRTSGVRWDVVASELARLYSEADYIAAHNVGYDRTLYEVECGRQAISPTPAKWICTLTDVPYPEHYKCRKLSHLALDHDFKVDPSVLHTAVGDVTLIADFLQFAGYTWENILAYKQIPWLYVQAVVDYDRRELAKKQRYSWEQAIGDDRKFNKTWVKKIKKDKLDEEMRKCPFEVRVLTA